MHHNIWSIITISCPYNKIYTHPLYEESTIYQVLASTYNHTHNIYILHPIMQHCPQGLNPLMLSQCTYIHILWSPPGALNNVANLQWHQSSSSAIICQWEVMSIWIYPVSKENQVSECYKSIKAWCTRMINILWSMTYLCNQYSDIIWDRK